MTPFPHLKQTSQQEAGGTPGVKKFQQKLQMNFKEDFFLGHPVLYSKNGVLRNILQEAQSFILDHVFLKTFSPPKILINKH